MQGDRAAEDLPLNLKREVEAVARGLKCNVGEWTLEFKLRDGVLMQTRRHHGPIRNEELARLAQTER